MRRAPVARVDTHDAPARVRHCVYQKRRRDLRGDALALFVYCVAVEQPRADSCATAPAPEGERLKGRPLNGAPRGQAGADAFAPAREACEIVEADAARQNHVRV